MYILFTPSPSITSIALSMFLAVVSSFPVSLSKHKVKLLAPFLTASLICSEEILLPPVATTLSTPLTVACKLSSSPSTITTSLSPLIPNILKKPEFLSSPLELRYLGVALLFSRLL